MAKPNTFRQNVREDAERAVNRALEQNNLDDDELETARSEWTKDSYDEFFADCRRAGKSTSKCGALWTRLKEMGEAPTGDDGGDEAGNPDAPAAAEPALPVPETVEEMEQAFMDADNTYLVVTTGCPVCNEAKEELSSWIDDGLVDVVNVQDSDLAADIVLETGLEGLPALVIENDGEYVPI